MFEWMYFLKHEKTNNTSIFKTPKNQQSTPILKTQTVSPLSKNREKLKKTKFEKKFLM